LDVGSIGWSSLCARVFLTKCESVDVRAWIERCGKKNGGARKNVTESSPFSDGWLK
jgi:hypothetical protein